MNLSPIAAYAAAAVAISAIVRLAVRCRHPHTVRERRTVKGVSGVLVLVCDRCGHAAPAIERTAAEHRRVKRQARQRPLRVQGGKVTPMRKAAR